MDTSDVSPTSLKMDTSDVSPTSNFWNTVFGNIFTLPMVRLFYGTLCARPRNDRQPIFWEKAGEQGFRWQEVARADQHDSWNVMAKDNPVRIFELWR